MVIIQAGTIKFPTLKGLVIIKLIHDLRWISVQILNTLINAMTIIGDGHYDIRVEQNSGV